MIWRAMAAVFFTLTHLTDLVCCLCIASPQQNDIRLLDLPSGQGAGGGVQTRDRRVSAVAGKFAISCATDPHRPGNGTLNGTTLMLLINTCKE
ncbi:hypothetical protein PoB_004248900 [Plakobranchus ocellatus]|uniref:Secreted protein n=1 Tax=Plakobranchus ocellatus TaxID=259542 RepID=A0AAV4BB82_9GAST|nr:hypothetical protein PoB_004248900 [Plakobranchus ocellatus]